MKTTISSDGNDIANRILLSLPKPTLQRLHGILHDPVELTRGQIIDHVDDRINYLYFINRGLVSLVKTMRDGRTVEVGAVGIEGITDPNALFGMNTAAIEAIVQVPGIAFRVARKALMVEMEHDRALRTIIEKYASFAFGQLAQNAACNRLHSIEGRCCRWLLMCNDSARSDSFPLTHEFLAMMLGVQRPSISIATKSLQTAGIIDYTHGRMKIIDRSGLLAAACECYESVHDQLAKLFPESRRVGSD